MELQSLALFVAVAHRGSFAAVARERAIDPSSVSRAVADLERDLGLRLFQRTTRRMALTEAGETFLARIEPLVEELGRAAEAVQSASGAPAGTLRLTASVTFGQRRIVPILGAFRARYPGLRIEAVFTDANVDLIAERIDLAVRLAPAVEGDLVAAKLIDTRYRVVASPAYLARHPLAAPQDLAGHRCLLFAIRAFRTRWLFRDAAGRVTEVPVDGDVTLSPAGSLLDATLADLGPALLPDWLITEDLAARRLVDCFPAFEATATTFDTAAWLVYPSRAYLPQKVRVMADFLRAALRRPGRPA
jgi:DNA-binding transcriptional LysR family regulator